MRLPILVLLSLAGSIGALRASELEPILVAEGGLVVEEAPHNQNSKDKRQVQYVVRSAAGAGKLATQYENAVASSAHGNELEQLVTREPQQHEEYRPGQVISVDTRQLYQLQPERNTPYTAVISQQALQQNYDEELTPLAIQPSRTMIARPQEGGAEAHVGAAFTVSDHRPDPALAAAFDRELLALLTDPEPAAQTAAPQPQPAPQQQPAYQPIFTQPLYAQAKAKTQRVKPRPAKQAKSRSKNYPQQYLIETTQPQQQSRQELRPRLQYAQPHVQQTQYAQAAPQSKYAQAALQSQYAQAAPQNQYAQVAPQNRYQQAAPQTKYEPNEQSPAVKVVTAPKIQLVRIPSQYPYGGSENQQTFLQNYRATPSEAKHLAESLKYTTVAEPQTLTERPVIYLKRYNVQQLDRPRQTKEYALPTDSIRYVTVNAQGDEPRYYLKQVQVTPRQLHEMQQKEAPRQEAPRVAAAQAHSTIYVNREGLSPRPKAQSLRQPAVTVEQHGSNVEEQRSRLPPPANKRAYTPEEFAALVAAGYSVTPIPVGGLQDEGEGEGLSKYATARTSPEPSSESRQLHVPRRASRPPTDYGYRLQQNEDSS